MHTLLDTVALTHDMPAVDLRRGDLGALLKYSTPSRWRLSLSQHQDARKR